MSQTTFEDALLGLGHALIELDEQPHRSGFPPYRFYTPTPETHAKVLRRLVQERKGKDGHESGSVDGQSAPARAELSLRAKTLRDFWGWSMSLSLTTGEEKDESARQKALGLFTFLQKSGIDAASPLLSIEEKKKDSGEAEDEESAQSDILFRPAVRFSSLYPPQRRPDPRNGPKAREVQLTRERVLYAHSAFSEAPPSDAVFFGPDTYRFVAFLSRALGACRAPAPDGRWKLGIDVGTGAGAGALALADLRRWEGPASSEEESADAGGQGHLIRRVIGSDIGPTALSYAKVNASLYDGILPLGEGGAGAAGDWSSRLSFREASLLSGLSAEEQGDVDLIISNPPYISFTGDHDAAAARGPTYADGGAQNGLALPLRILQDALEVLKPGGLALLYTGVPVGLDGVNPLWEACKACETQGDEGQERGLAQIEFWETMDVDVFGDELESANGPYGHSGVGSIQVVGVGMRKLE